MSLHEACQAQGSAFGTATGRLGMRNGVNIHMECAHGCVRLLTPISCFSVKALRRLTSPMDAKYSISVMACRRSPSRASASAAVSRPVSISRCHCMEAAIPAARHDRGMLPCRKAPVQATLRRGPRIGPQMRPKGFRAERLPESPRSLTNALSPDAGQND